MRKNSTESNFRKDFTEFWKKNFRWHDLNDLNYAMPYRKPYLGVHEDHGDLPVALGQQVDLGPHPDPSRLPLRPAPEHQ